MNKVGVIFSTSEYDLFQKLNGNRTVLEQRKKLIKASIKERGWIRNPIVVNEKMEIIDGQGRFEALRELEMPIEFTIAEGATISDCIALNIKQQNWKADDYINCYADMGYGDYIVLRSLLGKYPAINNASIHIVAGKQNQDGSNPHLRNGTFTIYDPASLQERLCFVNKCLEILGQGNGNRRTWCATLKFIWFCEKIDKKAFLERLEKYRGFLYPCVTARQAVELLERIYNYSSKKNKVYFIPEYEQWMAS